ncbi:SFP-type phosphopantetheinyl transferase [Cryptosporidium ubiquitum]|uniref:holo-[acyl-carrier-protein] synthase n=1 Tax=Cryptosporidium ubiquitum TaxID=857276 RepID=A0A1J4MIZ6_9CRYT|nr:SFP-type phosphopantetheinyl transferase [Cryptosporidium ubiquitum]OII72829.1 SFP-type phosphopantetheinyl transferase [Cryptosporidium ubiquitum]
MLLKDMLEELNLKKSLDLNDACILWCTLSEFSDLDFDKLINQLRVEILEDEEFERILRYKILNDRKRSLLSVLLMKLSLMNYYGISSKQVKIIREKGMKPYYKYNSEEPLIHFNVSHDGDIVVIILSKHIVGIDIMKSELPSRNKLSNNNIEEAKEKFLKNMANTFQPSEWEYIQKDISKFMHYWTIKESFVKYIGLGLYIDPKRLLIDGSLAKENNWNYSNSVSLEQRSIYMDNQMQKFQPLDNISKNQVGDSRKENTLSEFIESSSLKMSMDTDYEVLNEVESMSILRPKYPTHVVTKQGIELRSSSYGVEDREGNIGELLAVTQITGVVYMTFDSSGRLYSIKKDVAREFLGELQDERMNWE